MTRGSLPLTRFKCRWPKVKMRMTSIESISSSDIVARMEVTGHQIEATQAQMNNMIAAYSHEDFQPFKNMTDAEEPLIERLIDEAIVRGDNDTIPSNHISPR
ncbi:hypothetical protein AAG906_036999 [Vitis piasezkii]